jgi:hypothetical protein
MTDEELPVNPTSRIDVRGLLYGMGEVTDRRGYSISNPYTGDYYVGWQTVGLRSPG